MSKRLKIPGPPQQQKTVDGRFRIMQELGKGATGVVYEGVQLSVDRTVAIKVLHPNYNIRDDYKERFSREAKAIARLNHTNCITLYDFGFSEEFESLYMVTEYVRGRELYQITKKNKLELARVLDIGIQIADAINHAHQHGILHRDLKPENVLISSDWTAKVLDFGMARIVDELSNQHTGGRLTQQGAVYGTPAYMSPEQCQGNIDVNEQTDLYSLGVMLFELVQGELPYRAKKVLDILVQHVRDPIPQIDAEIPARLRNLIVSMMAKRPVERPSSAKIVAETLRSIRLEVPLIGEERNTLDVSQEIQRGLLKFDDGPDETGDGAPRTTQNGIGQPYQSAKDAPDEALTQDAIPTASGARETNPSAPPPVDLTPVPTDPASARTDESFGSSPSLDEIEFDDEPVLRRSSNAMGWVITFVLLLLAGAAVAYLYGFGDDDGSEANPSPNPAPAVAAPVTKPVEPAQEVAIAPEEPIVGATSGADAGVDAAVAAAAEAATVEAVPAKPKTRQRNTKTTRPTNRTAKKSQKEARPAKTDDGKKPAASSTTEVEKSEDEKLPTIRFTY